jgi:hypothetical protein
MTTKTVYQTDRAGLYMSDAEADESPLEPGVFLIPARAYLIAPPATWPDDKWPRWNGAGWDLVTRPSAPKSDATAKLAAFIASNPDVAALIGMQ